MIALLVPAGVVTRTSYGPGRRGAGGASLELRISFGAVITIRVPAAREGTPLVVTGPNVTTFDESENPRPSIVISTGYPGPAGPLSGAIRAITGTSEGIAAATARVDDDLHPGVNAIPMATTTARTVIFES